MIGGGAIAGGIIGKIIDREGSTEIGALAGAAAGTGLSAATARKTSSTGLAPKSHFFSSQSMQVAQR